MEDLALLRSRVYERDKHDAGWGASDSVSVTYVLGHTCASNTRNDPRGRKQTDARPRRHDNGYGDGFGNGYGNGNGNGHGNGDVYGYGYGDGFGNGCGGFDFLDFRCETGYSGGRTDLYKGQLWRI